MTRCFVPGCKSGYDSAQSVDDKRHFFRAPRNAERLQQWERAIPRLDRKLSSSCSVCDLHFINDDIFKVFEHNICGEIVVIPHDKWTLKEDAMPRLFPNCPSYHSKPTRKRKAPVHRRSPAKQKRQKKHGECVDAAVGVADDEASLSTDDSMPVENVFHVLSRMAKDGRKIRAWSLDVVDIMVVLYKLGIRKNIPLVEMSVVLLDSLNLIVSADGGVVHAVCTPGSRPPRSSVWKTSHASCRVWNS